MIPPSKSYQLNGENKMCVSTCKITFTGKNIRAAQREWGFREKETSGPSKNQSNV